MPSSPFTTLQDAHISSYMPDFEAEVHKVDPDFTSEKSKAGKLTTYKQAKAEEILESSLFKNKLSEDVNMGEWRKRIVKKFTNRFTTMKSKRGLSGMKSVATESTSLKLFEDITGRQLFEEAHKKNINEEATRRHKCSPSDNHVGHYQAVLREKWEGLDESERENYNNQARENASDIYLNQEQFMPAMWSEMKRMCQDGKLGDGEMMLLFAFRDEVGDVNSGVISAHSTHNKRDMKDFTDDFKTRIEVPWVTYANHVLPTNVSEELDSKYPIPCDSTGLPLFPGLNIHKLPPDDLKSYCVRYFSMLWEHIWPREKAMPKIPWDDISADPSLYYDSVIFSLPVKLNTPQSMSIPDLYSLVNYLSTSPHPFTFHSKETILHQIGTEQPSLMPDVTETPTNTNHQSDVEAPQKYINTPTDTSAIPKDAQYKSSDSEKARGKSVDRAPKSSVAAQSTPDIDIGTAAAPSTTPKATSDIGTAAAPSTTPQLQMSSIAAMEDPQAVDAGLLLTGSKKQQVQTASKPKTNTKSATTGSTQSTARKPRSRRKANTGATKNTSNTPKVPSPVGLKRQAVGNADISGNVGKRRKRAKGYVYVDADGNEVDG